MNIKLGDKYPTIAAATAIGFLAAFLWLKKKRTNKPPQKWMKVGEVASLYLYPIKSCKATKLQEVECTELGFKTGELRDRMFVVVDNDGKFVTGREYPKLTRLTSTMQDGRLTLSADGDGYEFDVWNLDKEAQKVKIWNATAEGVDCGDGVAEWLSRFILEQNTGLRLLYYGDRNVPKGMNPKLEKALKVTKKEFKETDASLFSDAAAYHLISESSVKELNTRLDDEKVSPLNFRPNIVINGEQLIPFEEDQWDWVKIGDVVFRFLAPCGRCLFTTVDPTSSTKSEKMEPVKTLRKYRLARDSIRRELFESPSMGIYLGARSKGFISVGDAVMIPQY